MTRGGGVGAWARSGLAVGQSVFGLFGAGAVLFEAHQFFLRYYAQEWGAVQYAGVNGCAHEESIVNGDLLMGQTLCNQPENFVPWVVVYRHHPTVAAIYYGSIITVIVLIGFVLHLIQRRLATTTPFGSAPAPSPVDSEHLR